MISSAFLFEEILLLREYENFGHILIFNFKRDNDLAYLFPWQLLQIYRTE